jgi:hypothetical protein
VEAAEDLEVGKIAGLGESIEGVVTDQCLGTCNILLGGRLRIMVADGVQWHGRGSQEQSSRWALEGGAELR